MTGRQFRLLYTKQALDDIKKLDTVVKKRIAETLERYVSNPFLFARKLTKPKLIGQYRCRVGDYRVIFNVRGKNILILSVGHRREIYKR